MAIAAGALALFLTVLVLLAWQVRSGRDPALGAARHQPALVAQAPQRVLVRKVVRRVIEEKVVQTDDGPAAVVVRSAPTVVYAAPAATSAPAPAPAPAPAAPVVTKTS
jgi:hypothetical protein